MKHTLLIIFTLLLLCAAYTSCSVVRFAKAYHEVGEGKDGEFKDNIFFGKDTTYRIGNLSKEWKRIDSRKGDLLFWNPKKKAVITVNSTCKGSELKYSLEVLSNSLVIGIKDKKLIERRTLKVDDIDALYSRYVGTFEGYKVHLATIVFKTDRCVYDTSFTQIIGNKDKDITVKRYLEFVGGFKILS